MIHLATAIVVRGGRLLMVASRYANHSEPLWNLPGGRQERGELLGETVVREVFEETGLRVTTVSVAYVSESYDRDDHFINVTFNAELTPPEARSDDARHDVISGDHVVAVEWVPIAEVGERIVVGVVREPLIAYLSGSLSQRYAGFRDAGVTIVWPRDSQ